MEEDYIKSRILFGKIIKTLRQEISRRFGEFTQEDLVQELDERGIKVSREWVSKLENGKSANFLEPDLLLSLADIFELTTRERNSFFRAANPINDYEIAIKNNLTADYHLKNLYQTVSKMQTPVFVTDSFSRIVVANNLFLNLFPIPRVKNMDDSSLNVLKLLSKMESELKENGLSEQEWENMMVKSIQIFRGISFVHRPSKYITNLLDDLFKSSKQFGIYWLKASQEDEYYDHHMFQITNRSFQQPILYVISFSQVFTRFGPLYLESFVPSNSLTVEVFSNLLTNVGEGAQFLASWPYVDRE